MSAQRVAQPPSADRPARITRRQARARQGVQGLRAVGTSVIPVLIGPAMTTAWRAADLLPNRGTAVVAAGVEAADAN